MYLYLKIVYYIRALGSGLTCQFKDSSNELVLCQPKLKKRDLYPIQFMKRLGWVGLVNR